MLCFASTELRLKIIPAGMVVVDRVCVCVFGGGGGGFLFRDRKILMYCFIASSRTTP